MADLVIPEPYRPGLQMLVDLSDRGLDDLAAAVQEHPLTAGPKDLIATVAGSVADVSANDVESMLDALLVVNGVRAFLSLDVPEFADALCKAKDLRVASDRREVVRDHLIRLLNSRYLNVTSKALNVVTEYERTFHGARVMTDLRPIFGTNAKESPSAAVIVHTLRLTYHERQELRDFYVTFDTRDLQILQAVLERAGDKAESLRGLIQAAGLPFIDTEVQ